MTHHAISRSANLKWIRTTVFELPQEEFAHLLDLQRTRLSKYETGRHAVPIEVQHRVRQLAADRDIAWDDRWFFEVPSQGAAA